MEKYFQDINNKVKLAYNVANEARKKGLDPVDVVEIPLARNMAERIEGLISIKSSQIKGSGIVNRIEELEKIYEKSDWRVAFKIAGEVAQEKFCKFNDKKEAIEIGLRIGFAYLTNGVATSPLEGFTYLKLRDRKDGKGKYFALFFSGPIRSAGTTAACVFVALADYVRKLMGFEVYDPTEEEIKRTVVELLDFHERITNLQYLPSEEETAFMVKHLPVQIDGDPSEDLDVSNYKDLDRIETNRLRNGVCLTIGEGLTQKASKFYGKFSRWMKDFDMEHWIFLEKFVKLQKKIRAKEIEDSEKKIKPDYNFIKDLVAGRPVLTHPLAIGGLRLRYGRCRTTGLSSMGLHPATLIVLDKYIAIGTQLKVERPSKGTAISICDSIEGPIVKLNNGNVLFLDDAEKAEKYNNDVEEILFLGDVLVNYGDFLDRAHILVPPGYCEEWWLGEVKKAVIEKFNEINFDILSKSLELNKEFLVKLFNDFTTNISAKDAINISEKLNVSLHPRWTYHWNDINKEQLYSLIRWLEQSKIEDNKIILPWEYKVLSDLENTEPKRVLEFLGVPHSVVSRENIVIEKDDAVAFVYSFGDLKNFKMDKENVLDIINENCKIRIKDKSGIYIGARMGRPEKAKIRKLTGSPHILFPVGKQGGKLRSFQSALERGYIEGQFPIYYCDKCEKRTIYPACEICNNKTTKQFFCKKCNSYLNEEICKKHGNCLPYDNIELPINHYFSNALNKLNLKDCPDLIKGVRGTSNEDHTPENLSKGILRALHNLYVNKDGTIRFDMTELAITAFKPKEIGTNIEKLKELGYDKDIYGNDLVDEDQVVELKCQDLILPKCIGSSEEGADVILFRTTEFIDDLLKNFYGLDKFYNLKSEKNLVGHLVVALAPHICAGMIGRIVGFSNSQGFYAHPLFHCAIRRDVDGDEAAVILLMDALLNFSRKYLPAHRGATQDAPLVLTSTLIPSEVDDMVFNLDVVFNYPLEFYEACVQYKWPWEFKIEQLKDRLGKEEQYYNFGFTHKVSNINNGVLCSAYKSIPSMQEKVLGQVKLAEKIRAVDEVDVARLVIERHFIRDIKGNLRKFSQQQFRCVECNEKYRRPPLSGICLKCGGRIIFTVAEGSVVKYLEPSLSLAERYNLPNYIKQSLELTKMRIESVFGKEKEKQEGLGKWFG